MAPRKALLIARMASALRRLGSVLIVAIGVLVSQLGPAVAGDLPWRGDVKHVGVGVCAGPCHGRQSAAGAASGGDMRGSEVIVWHDTESSRGKHSQAYAALLGQRGQDIGRRLGYRPETAPACLACHADPVDGGHRDRQFRLADGVGCETCHGGAEKWLATHYAPARTPEERAARHRRNLASGLYPLENTGERARVCLSCHLGSAAPNQFVTHQIMSAGHPRLSFELELFTSLQQHHVDDAQYRAAKPGAVSRGNVWAIGQAVAARTSVSLFLQAEAHRTSVLPELAYFDCHSCHRPIADGAGAEESWRPNPLRAPETGVVSFNDADTIVLAAAARALGGAQLAGAFEAKARAFQMSLLRTPAERAGAGKDLVEVLNRLTGIFSSTGMTAQRAEAVLREVVARSQTERYTTYGSAEQAVMAIDSLSRTMIDAGGASGARAARLRPAIDAAYKTVTEPASYNPDAFRAALAAIEAGLGA